MDPPSPRLREPNVLAGPGLTVRDDCPSWNAAEVREAVGSLHEAGAGLTEPSAPRRPQCRQAGRCPGGTPAHIAGTCVRRLPATPARIASKEAADDVAERSSGRAAERRVIAVGVTTPGPLSWKRPKPRALSFIGITGSRHPILPSLEPSPRRTPPSSLSSNATTTAGVLPSSGTAPVCQRPKGRSYVTSHYERLRPRNPLPLIC